MQLGIGSYTYGWCIGRENNGTPPAMNECDLVDKANEFGIKLLQIGDNLPMHEWSEKRLNAFEKKLKENNFELEIGAKGLTEEHLKLYIQLCKRFDVRILRFIIDDKKYQPSLHEIISLIESHIEILTQNNIKLALENHDRFKASEYSELIKQMSSLYVGICLDTVNSMAVGESIEYIIETLAPHTVNLHMKDFGISRLCHKQGFIIDGRVAGEGLLNIPSLLGKLQHSNRCHTCILEQWVPPERSTQETLEKEQEWASKSIAYLKSLPGLN